MELFADITETVDQRRLHKAVDILIFVTDLQCAVFYVCLDLAQAVNDLIGLFLCENALSAEHDHMCDTALDVLLIKLLVKTDGCVEIVYQLICLFCEASAP